MDKVFLNELDEKERIVYKIAQQHLKSSFNITRTNGYIEFKKKREQKISFNH